MTGSVRHRLWWSGAERCPPRRSGEKVGGEKVTHFYDADALASGQDQPAEKVDQPEAEKVAPENSDDDLWVAVLYADGYAWDSFAEAVEVLGEEHDSLVHIEVVRGTALPVERQMPSSYDTGDVAHEHQCWLVDPDDETVGAAVRFAQAQAMAMGLNVAAVTQ